MHRIASFGDVQESNKSERHHVSHAPSSKEAEHCDNEDEYQAALVDFGRVFETVMKYTVVAVVTAAWQSVGGLYHLVKNNDYAKLWEPMTELYHGEP